MKLTFKILSVLIISLPFLSCEKDGFSGPTTKTSIAIETANVQNSLSGKSSTIVSKNNSLSNAGWIDSGAPEYLKVTLKRLEVEGNFDGGSAVIWSGEKELILSGAALDISDINSEISDVPVGELTKVKVLLDSKAKIKGSLTGDFKLDDTNGPDGEKATLSVFTKADYAYNATNTLGGSANYNDFIEGPAEETNVWLSADGDDLNLEFPLNASIQEGDLPVITLFFDLNRVLRFYNGKKGTDGGGVNPKDPADKAYFFNHSLFGGFMAVFLGEVGTMEGYQSTYNYNGTEVEGWLSLLFDNEDNFVSGMIIGDNDNDLTIAKGRIEQFEKQSDGTYNFTYGLDGNQITFDVTDFTRQIQLENETVGSFEGSLGGTPMSGPCSFTLKLKN